MQVIEIHTTYHPFEAALKPRQVARRESPVASSFSNSVPVRVGYLMPNYGAASAGTFNRRGWTPSPVRTSAYAPTGYGRIGTPTKWLPTLAAHLM